jgi:aspartate kinase
MVLEGIRESIGSSGIDTDTEIAKVSLVGAGMKSHPGVAADMFDALATAGVNIEIISTSSIRVSCVIRRADMEEAVKAVHRKFQLPDEAIVREQHPLTATGQIEALQPDGDGGRS